MHDEISALIFNFVKDFNLRFIMLRLFLGVFYCVLFCLVSGCHTNSQEAVTVQNELQPEIASRDSAQQGHSSSATGPTQIHRSGAMIIESKVVADDNLEYSCKIWFASDTPKAIRGFELVNYHDNGGLHNTYNLVRSIKPLGKVKLKIVPRGEATVSFPVASSNVNPVISKIFYKDGSIQHTAYDVLRGEFEQPTLNAARVRDFSPNAARQSYEAHDKVAEYYDRINKAAETNAPFVQQDVEPQ